MKQVMLDMSMDEIKQCISEIDSSTFRYKQIYKWLHKGVAFSDMTNISKALRVSLAEKYTEGHAIIHEKLVSKIDGTKKYLFRLHDGVLVEGVLMQYEYGATLCISTQAGCSMACTFCSSAIDGKTRDLSDGDMLAQVLAVVNDIGGERPINNIVLMGSGEPLDNYDNTLKFLRKINSKDSLNIGFRSISLSTCGLVDGIYAFANENIPITMCISLHAGNDETRKKIMPIANKYTIEQTIKAAEYYFDTTGRRIIIEYVLIAGVNDDKQNAIDLAKAIRGLNCNVNIIRLNAGRDEYKPATNKATKEFIDTLEDNKIKAILRRNMGSDIFGACGQLRHQATVEGT